MSNYSKLVNFAAKDSLPSGDAGKLIKGTEINTELNNIQTAVNSKADSNSSALTGTPTAPTAAVGTNTTQIATTAYVYNLVGGLTATPAELNVLDGITATTAELNILDGVTATASELNALDGITATVAELNILDGVTATAAELNVLDGVTATTAELNYVDGVTSNVQTQLNAKEPTQTAASQAEMEAGTETAVRSMSPLRVAQAIAELASTPSANLAQSGHWKDNATGLTINWGRSLLSGGNSELAVTFDEAFSTAGLISLASYYWNSVSLTDAATTHSLTTSGMTVVNGSGSTVNINWLAIGY
jgi:hypothetical protein